MTKGLDKFRGIPRVRRRERGSVGRAGPLNGPSALSNLEKNLHLVAESLHLLPVEAMCPVPDRGSVDSVSRAREVPHQVLEIAAGALVLALAEGRVNSNGEPQRALSQIRPDAANPAGKRAFELSPRRLRSATASAISRDKSRKAASCAAIWAVNSTRRDAATDDELPE